MSLSHQKSYIFTLLIKSLEYAIMISTHFTKGQFFSIWFLLEFILLKIAELDLTWQQMLKQL